METIRFEDLELDAKIMRAITDMGFEAASPIQVFYLIEAFSGGGWGSF